MQCSLFFLDRRIGSSEKLASFRERGLALAITLGLSVMAADTATAGSTAFAKAADPADPWRGVLYSCGDHPTVHIPAHVVYAYEKDLTHYTEGAVSFGKTSATLRFPGQYGTFTIVRRTWGFFVDGKKCKTDPV